MQTGRMIILSAPTEHSTVAFILLLRWGGVSLCILEHTVSLLLLVMLWIIKMSIKMANKGSQRLTRWASAIKKENIPTCKHRNLHIFSNKPLKKEVDEVSRFSAGHISSLAGISLLASSVFLCLSVFEFVSLCLSCCLLCWWIEAILVYSFLFYRRVVSFLKVLTCGQKKNTFLPWCSIHNFCCYEGLLKMASAQSRRHSGSRVTCLAPGRTSLKKLKYNKIKSGSLAPWARYPRSSFT